MQVVGQPYVENFPPKPLQTKANRLVNTRYPLNRPKNSLVGSPSPLSVMAESSLHHLVAMGYSKAQATRALQVAAGDVEQAVGFLLMGENSRRQLGDNLGSSIALGEEEYLSTPLENPAKTPGAVAVASDKLDELVQMGYDRNLARQALSVSNGDIGQAVNFLLMGDSRADFVLELQSSFRYEDDAAMAAVLQQDEIGSNPRSTDGLLTQASSQESAMYHATTMRSNNDIPKMVASDSYLTTPGAGPFCACIAASKFLSGGIVTAEFLNRILEGGIELFRKADSQECKIGKILKKYGRNLSIKSLGGDDEPKSGIFMEHDLQHTLGLRKQLALCRNKQPNGWQVLLLEIPNFEAFCIALPPKGTKNKFWYLDFYPRSCFRVAGAYARVHSTLLQLEESLEEIFKKSLDKVDKDYHDFTIHMVTKHN